MNVLHNGDLRNSSHFCAILMFNHSRESSFLGFIQSVIDHKPLIAELCTVEYEDVDEKQQYRFDTDEGETIIISYSDMLFYIKKALQEFIEICTDENEKAKSENPYENL